jgi:hypothetical protein
MILVDTSYKEHAQGVARRPRTSGSRTTRNASSTAGARGFGRGAPRRVPRPSVPLLAADESNHLAGSFLDQSLLTLWIPGESLEGKILQLLIENQAERIWA